MDRRDFLVAAPAVLAPLGPVYVPADNCADVVANVLVRGQSNALLFCDRGGIWKVASQLERAGLHIAILAEWGTNTSTIHSGTRFMDWLKNGQQAALLAFLKKQAPEIRARKTITLWIHNENEQNSGVSKGDWVKEVRADAGLVRRTLGQTSTTTPYMFCPIRYNFGKNLSFLDGMKELVADVGFNATLSEAFLGASMSGDGQPNSSHLGDEDMAPVAVALAPAVIALLRKLALNRINEPAAR